MLGIHKKSVVTMKDSELNKQNTWIALIFPHKTFQLSDLNQ